MMKLIKGIAVTLMILGFVLIYGAVGSVENGDMECSELMVRTAIGFGAMLGGGYIVHKQEEEEC